MTLRLYFTPPKLFDLITVWHRYKKKKKKEKEKCLACKIISSFSLFIVISKIHENNRLHNGATFYFSKKSEHFLLHFN